MPDLTDQTGKIYILPQPLIVGLGNGQCAPPGTKVRFSVIVPSTGLVAVAGTPTPTGQTVDVPLNAQNGMALCDFHLDGTHYSQQVRAQLLDAAGLPCSLPIIFNATLSKASEVAYDPKGCAALQGKKTVQDAMAHLAALVRIDKVGGDGQDTDPGQPVPNKLIVRVSNKCGPVDKATVTFTVVEGFVDDLIGIPSFTTKTVAVATNSSGVAECLWRTAGAPNTQQLRAEITGLPAPTQGSPGLALGAHREVHFTANLRQGTCCTFTVGDGDTSHGRFSSIQAAVDQLPEVGGKICLLPGEYEENVRIVNRRNVTISGCGRRSIVRSPASGNPANAALPAISIIGGFNITLECFAVEADATGLGILIRGRNPFSTQAQEADAEVIGAILSELKVTAVQQSAVRARFVRDLVVRSCTLTNRAQRGRNNFLSWGVKF